MATSLKKFFPTVRTNVPIGAYLNFGVGGRVANLLEVRTSSELAGAVAIARGNKIDFVVVAGGSNVFFADGKIDRLVIIYRREKVSAKDFILDGDTIECDGSIILADLIKYAIKNNLAGIECMTGVPGTVGGAVVGGAGAFGQWINDRVEAVQIADKKGPHWLSRPECKFGYKTSIFKKKKIIVLRVRIKLEKVEDSTEIAARSKEIARIRHKKFKNIINCCPGSFFKNIPEKRVPKKAWPLLKDCRVSNGEIPSGYLLEQVGARGMKVGKIQVTDFHGNLIINNGGGKARDVLKLADKLKEKVQAKYGIKLEQEAVLIK